MSNQLSRKKTSITSCRNPSFVHLLVVVAVVVSVFVPQSRRLLLVCISSLYISSHCPSNRRFLHVFEEGRHRPPWWQRLEGEQTRDCNNWWQRVFFFLITCSTGDTKRKRRQPSNREFESFWRQSFFFLKKCIHMAIPD